VRDAFVSELGRMADWLSFPLNPRPEVALAKHPSRLEYAAQTELESCRRIVVMGDKPARPRKKPLVAPSGQPIESRLEPSGEVVVEHLATPPAGPADLKIHARRPLPLVPNASSQPREEEDKKED
jgi:hypothetical protein